MGHLGQARMMSDGVGDAFSILAAGSEKGF